MSKNKNYLELERNGKDLYTCIGSFADRSGTVQTQLMFGYFSSYSEAIGDMYLTIYEDDDYDNSCPLDVNAYLMKESLAELIKKEN